MVICFCHSHLGKSEMIRVRTIIDHLSNGPWIVERKERVDDCYSHFMECINVYRAVSECDMQRDKGFIARVVNRKGDVIA